MFLFSVVIMTKCFSSCAFPFFYEFWTITTDDSPATERSLLHYSLVGLSFRFGITKK